MGGCLELVKRNVDILFGKPFRKQRFQRMGNGRKWPKVVVNGDKSLTFITI